MQNLCRLIKGSGMLINEVAMLIISLISLALGAISVIITIISVCRYQKIKNILNLYAGSISDQSHSILYEMNIRKLSPDILERYGNFNHTLVLFLCSIDKAWAAEFIAIRKNENEWPEWAHKLRIKLNQIQKAKKKLSQS